MRCVEEYLDLRFALVVGLAPRRLPCRASSAQGPKDRPPARPLACCGGHAAARTAWVVAHVTGHFSSGRGAAAWRAAAQGGLSPPLSMSRLHVAYWRRIIIL